MGNSRYCILASSSVSDLENQVNQFLGNGWLVLGPPTCVVSGRPNESPLWYQAVVKSRCIAH